MNHLTKTCWSLAAVLVMVVAASCGRPAPPKAAYRPATAAEPSAPKAEVPAGALPSQVVAGDVAAYRAASAEVGLPKNRDATGSLPSSVAAGESAAHAPPERATGE